MWPNEFAAANKTLNVGDIADSKPVSTSTSDIAGELRTASWPVSDLLLLVNVYSARKVDGANTPVPLEATRLKESWEKLRRKYPEEFFAGFPSREGPKATRLR
jgi:hypothetical protein